MVFSSVTFIYLFLPVALILYYAAPKFMRNLIIFLSGLVFYAWGEPVYVIIMVISILIDYLAGRVMGANGEKKGIRKVALITSVVMNIGLLGVFKYSGFFVGNINALLGISIPVPDIALPIGISFFTFQSMSYTIDLYMGNIKMQKSFLNFAAYVTLFPQIVAGPIVRYADVQNEIDHRRITLDMVGEEIGLFVKGLAKKVLLANNIGMLWTSVKATPVGELSVLSAWLGILAFTFQIYYDFSGYSDMAVGMGKMMGFHFPKNFNFPYISKSISEFWRRWHITLGTWFKSYVYFPLGGSRKGIAKTIRNLFVVWMLTGFWHGASWNFMLWGIYFGIIIILERYVYGKFLEKLPSFIRIAYSFLLVVFGWVLFEFDELSACFAYFGAMFGVNSTSFSDTKGVYWLISYLLTFILCIVFSTELIKKLHSKLNDKMPKVMEYAVPILQFAAMIICTAYLVDATFNPFLYFNF